MIPIMSSASIPSIPAGSPDAQEALEVEVQKLSSRKRLQAPGCTPEWHRECSKKTAHQVISSPAGVPPVGMDEDRLFEALSIGALD